MFRRMLTVTAASVLGVTMLTTAPAQAAGDSVGPVTIKSLTTTEIVLSYACTGAVRFVDVQVSSAGSGFAEAQSFEAPACTGAVRDHTLPLFSYAWSGNAARSQLVEGTTAGAMVSVETRTAEWGSASLGARVGRGTSVPVTVLQLASVTPVAVWAGNGKPYADVWFRCDRGLRVTAEVGSVSFDSGSRWVMPPTTVSCTGTYQKARAALVRTDDSATVPRTGERVSAYPNVSTAHLMSLNDGRTVRTF